MITSVEHTGINFLSFCKDKYHIGIEKLDRTSSWFFPLFVSLHVKSVCCVKCGKYAEYCAIFNLPAGQMFVSRNGEIIFKLYTKTIYVLSSSINIIEQGIIYTRVASFCGVMIIIWSGKLSHVVVTSFCDCYRLYLKWSWCIHVVEASLYKVVKQLYEEVASLY